MSANQLAYLSDLSANQLAYLSDLSANQLAYLSDLSANQLANQLVLMPISLKSDYDEDYEFQL